MHCYSCRSNKEPCDLPYPAYYLNYVDTIRHPERWYVECSHCGTKAAACESKNKAAKAWNENQTSLKIFNVIKAIRGAT